MKRAMHGREIRESEVDQRAQEAKAGFDLKRAKDDLVAAMDAAHAQGGSLSDEDADELALEVTKETRAELFGNAQ